MYGHIIFICGYIFACRDWLYLCKGIRIDVYMRIDTYGKADASTYEYVYGNFEHCDIMFKI